MADQYDTIIIGGGHNGLVAAAKLAQAGRRVLVALLNRFAQLGRPTMVSEIAMA